MAAFRSIDEYHRSCQDDIRERILAIGAIVRDVVPEAEECLSYQMPCFRYRGELFCYSGFENHISVLNSFSEAFWERFKTDLAGFKTSRLVIQLPSNKPFPEKLIKEIVEFRKTENEEKI